MVKLVKVKLEAGKLGERRRLLSKIPIFENNGIGRDWSGACRIR